MNTTLMQLAALGKQLHPWDVFVDIIRDSYALTDADGDGFTVMTSTGIEEVHLPDGLTVDLYNYLAKWCDDTERAVLALGVLQRNLGFGYHDWDCILTLLRNRFGRCPDSGILPDEDWLLDIIEEHGFQRITDICIEAFNLYREENPRPIIRWDIYITPRWDRASRTLSYGTLKESFRRGAVMVFAVLDSLQAKDWNPTNCLPAAQQIRFYATWQDIRDAVTVIKEKTPQVLLWSATTDGVVRWKAV